MNYGKLVYVNNYAHIYGTHTYSERERERERGVNIFKTYLSVEKIVICEMQTTLSFL